MNRIASYILYETIEQSKEYIAENIAYGMRFAIGKLFRGVLLPSTVDCVDFSNKSRISHTRARTTTDSSVVKSV